jgi:hypothetical protein
LTSGFSSAGFSVGLSAVACATSGSATGSAGASISPLTSSFSSAGFSAGLSAAACVAPDSGAGSATGSACEYPHCSSSSSYAQSLSVNASLVSGGAFNPRSVSWRGHLIDRLEGESDEEWITRAVDSYGTGVYVTLPMGPLVVQYNVTAQLADWTEESAVWDIFCRDFFMTCYNVRGYLQGKIIVWQVEDNFIRKRAVPINVSEREEQFVYTHTSSDHSFYMWEVGGTYSGALNKYNQLVLQRFYIINNYIPPLHDTRDRVFYEW